MSIRLSRIIRAVDGIELPSFPAICGPAEIARAVIERRRAHARLGLGGENGRVISDEGIERLVAVAYHASQLSDEGRFPRFRLVNSMQLRGTRMGAFMPSIPIGSPADLRRIACICDDPDHALCITETEGVLSCDGIAHVGPLGHEFQPGRPELVRRGGATPFSLDIKGPGFIVACGGEMSIELRGGRGQVLSPVSLVPAFAGLLERFGETCSGVRIPDQNDPARAAHGGAAGAISGVASSVLRDVLRRMVDGRHGGSIVIVPDARGASAPTPLSVRCCVSDLDFGQKIGDFFLTCVGSGTDGLKDWHTSRARLESGIAALYGFTLVDGCVVMNEQLDTVGFGAEILVRDEDARRGMAFASYKRRETFAYDDFMQHIGGTRHRSAARLCATIPGAVAFVVSQDGELRVFCNDGVQAFGFGPLDTE